MTKEYLNPLGWVSNPSAKLAEVADDVFIFGASPVNYKLQWWRLNTLQSIPTWNMKLNKLNPLEDANKMACGELEWLEKWWKLPALGVLKSRAYPNINNALTLSNPIDTKLT